MNKSSNQIACLHPAAGTTDLTLSNQPMLCWCYAQSVCSCCFSRLSVFQTLWSKLAWRYHVESVWPGSSHLILVGKAVLRKFGQRFEKKLQLSLHLCEKITTPPSPLERVTCFSNSSWEVIPFIGKAILPV